MRFSAEPFGVLNKPTCLLPRRDALSIWHHTCVLMGRTPRLGPPELLTSSEPPEWSEPQKTAVPTGKRWRVTSIGNCPQQLARAAEPQPVLGWHVLCPHAAHVPCSLPGPHASGKAVCGTERRGLRELRASRCLRTAKPQRNGRIMISQGTLAKPAEIIQTFRACL